MKLENFTGLNTWLLSCVLLHFVFVGRAWELSLSSILLIRPLKKAFVKSLCCFPLKWV
ncbi:hypothetical protein P153DRAFT_362693 [Dothidotthia symphoricarpi CBS 119687]|uniref:Uncharacterized protein n=1 Tax=Dothidotthia symphoricarpi CBS 119687 TaxID=1392245 RepID=A0A6A6ASK4_9PLEO|nr:uncharacterized protein P153DRAFT_362693 [Dothidotthia symphoricarpi CBS 119687]KAF2134992.1 hypothetical protein P153DRAFT_362693 [Dothidotthia symphoricarpi CBS 119687]